MPACAEQGGYAVKPHDPAYNNTTSGPIDTKGADAIISFWDAPLWTQIAYSVQLMALALISIKLFPILLGKLKRLRETDKYRAILDFISGNPGVTTSRIAKKTGINRDTVKYHVNNLILAGKLYAEKIGKYTLVFNRKHTRPGKHVMAHLGSETEMKVMRAVLDKQGISNVEIARCLGLDKSTVHWHIDRLVRDGVVVYEKDGPFKRYYLTDEAKEAVNNLEP